VEQLNKSASKFSKGLGKIEFDYEGGMLPRYWPKRNRVFGKTWFLGRVRPTHHSTSWNERRCMELHGL